MKTLLASLMLSIVAAGCSQMQPETKIVKLKKRQFAIEQLTVGMTRRDINAIMGNSCPVLISVSGAWQTEVYVYETDCISLTYSPVKLGQRHLEDRLAASPKVGKVEQRKTEVSLATKAK